MNKSKLIELIKKSGLKTERQEYWLRKIEAEIFTAEDEQTFINEMEEHLEQLKTNLFDKKALLQEKQFQLNKTFDQLIPQLELIAGQSEAIFHEDTVNYKNEVLAVENEAMKAIEHVRQEDEQAEIAKIKASL